MFSTPLNSYSPVARQETFCSLCEQRNVKFDPLPDFYRQTSTQHGFKHFGRTEMIALDSYSCPSCGASDRERLYAWWLEKQIESGQIKMGLKLLHFAPEVAFSRKLRQLNIFDYKTADYMMHGVDYQLDIINISLDDESIDFFICSHVLEHVDSDDKAIQELFRITKSGGRGILEAPICLDIDATIEDPSAVTDADRWRLFGQNDHVRLYAHEDYVNKITSHGFALEQLGINEFGQDCFSRLGLSATSILYVVTKP